MDPRRILLTGLIDYAGLFPPARLDMSTAVRNYGAYRSSPDSWMLARFISPVARLSEFERNAAPLLPRQPSDEPWPISAIVGEELDREIDAIFEFNRRHSEPENGLAVVDTIELRAGGPRDIDRAMGIIPEQLTPFFEVPPGDDIRGLITAMAGTGAHAKIRCGGVTHDLFPSSEFVANFIACCAAAEVPFKATAGLHHPVRSDHPLTYEPESPSGTMHGFLNVFLAAAMIRRANMTIPDAIELLEERDPAEFRFGDETISWKQYSLDAGRLASARESFAIAFGSCSFEEPVADLRSLRAI